MKELLELWRLRRAAKRIAQRRAEINQAIEYSQEQVRFHLDHMQHLLDENARLCTDELTLSLPGRLHTARRGGAPECPAFLQKGRSHG